VNVPWREQYDRMLRWKERLWLDPMLHGEHAVDSLYVFAQTCFHLTDWLENDRSQHVRREQAERYVASSPTLAFCRDICNGSKHAKLEAKKVRVTTRKVVESYSIQDETGVPLEGTVERTELFVDLNGEVIDIETFGARCIEEWNRFLVGEGLLRPS